MAQLPEVGDLKPPDKDVTPPELTFSSTWTDDKDGKWQAGPDISVKKPDTGDKDQEPLVDLIPQVHAFTVNTGNIVDNVKLALTEIKTAVAAYNTHKTYVTSREGWVFSVATKEDVGADGNPFSDIDDSGTFDFSTGMWWNSESQNYSGPSREMVTQLNTYQHKLLMSAADVITLVGQFNLAVDGAAQAYAQIDYSSQFPDPPTITEITLDNNTGNMT